MTTSFTDLYVQIQQFYATQVQHLDALEFDEFAATFTEDGEFGHSDGTPPAKGRAEITTALSEYQKRRYGDDPTQRRHWFDMLKVSPRPDGSIETSYYAVVLATKPGNPVAVPTPSCFVRDVLVPQDGRLLVRRRLVSPDHVG